MRTVVPTLIAGVLAVMGASVAGPALAAQAAPAARAQDLSTQSYTTTTATPASGIAVAIDSLSPRYVSPATSTIEVKGTVTNHTGGPVAGVQVQLWTGSSFTSRSQMEDFASGRRTFLVTPVYPALWQDPQTLHTGSTAAWSISFPASLGGFTGFGVFPLAAQSSSPASGGSSLGVARTLLPYWPGSSPGGPTKLNIAWVWPLIGTPQQGACPQALPTNSLAASLAPAGRLGGLLAAGLRYSAATRLTWAVDPALLSDASVMTERYKVGGNALCIDTRVMPPSAAAGTWLASLKAGTAGNAGMFVTPYADPDVSALTHAGLDTDIGQDYALGNEVAFHLLGRPFGRGPVTAWPGGGDADASVLTALAREGHVSTTVLSSAEMPLLPGNYAEDAVTHVTTGMSTPMNVLLADSRITALLGTATAASPGSSQFAVTQNFLAETAMIVAEAPYAGQRSVVIAPPRRWDPSAAEAGALLSLSTTASAPWLRPVSLGSLTSQRASTVSHADPPDNQAASRELGREYLGEVADVQQMAGEFATMLAQPQVVESQLQAAVAGTESTAWRGAASGRGQTVITSLRDYIQSHEAEVRFVSGNKVVLGGTSGATPVSVFNGQQAAIRVQVRAIVPPGSPLSVSSPAVQTIEAGQTVTFRLQVHSAPLGSTLLRLQLLSANGTPLTWTPRSSLNVETTRFGRTLLILIAAALGVLVLTSAARWVRRWLRDGGSGHHVGGGGAGGSGTPGDSAGSGSTDASGASASGAGWSSASATGIGSGGTG